MNKKKDEKAVYNFEKKPMGFGGLIPKWAETHSAEAVRLLRIFVEDFGRLVDHITKK
jgi:hypothetical protein